MKSQINRVMPNVTDLLLDTVFLVDIQGRIVHVNAACERMFGYTPDEMIGQSLIDLVAPEDRERTLEEAALVKAGHSRIGFENRYIRKDGSFIHVMWSARWSKADQLRIGVARDVTERKRMEELQAATYAISEAVHNTGDLTALFQEIHRIIGKLVPVAGFTVTICDPWTRQIDMAYQTEPHGNPHILSKPVILQHCAEVIQRRQAMVLPGDALDPLHDRAIPTGESACWLIMPLITQQTAIGAAILKSRPGTAYSDKDKELLQFVSAQVATAIERRQLHSELLRSARYDQLTGLPNRYLFDERIMAALTRCKRKQGRMAVLFVDVDHFKEVNDLHGHAVGDKLLQEFAQRLKQNTREEDTVARLGGDEFIVLLEEIDAQDGALAYATNIRSVMLKPFTIENLALHIQASIGIAVYPEHGVEIEQLLKHADDAMYVDKKNKTGRISNAMAE